MKSQLSGKYIFNLEPVGDQSGPVQQFTLHLYKGPIQKDLLPDELGMLKFMRVQGKGKSMVYVDFLNARPSREFLRSQGRTVGTAILEHFAEWAQANGIDTIRTRFSGSGKKFRSRLGPLARKEGFEENRFEESYERGGFEFIRKKQSKRSTGILGRTRKNLQPRRRI